MTIKRSFILVFGVLLIAIFFNFRYTPSQVLNQNRSASQTSEWLKVSTRVNAVQELTFSPNGDLYALLIFGLMRSTDNGQTWTTLKVDVPRGYENLTCVAASDGIIFVGAKHNSGDISILLTSSDGGKSWTHVKFRPQDGIKDLPYEIESLAVDSNGDLWAGADIGSLFRSTDKGKTWTLSGKLSVYETVAAIAFGPGGRIYAAVARTGIFRSDDMGRTWTNTG
jgi:photosystem II stability/assembly factor-like uncharacterized protein